MRKSLFASTALVVLAVAVPAGAAKGVFAGDVGDGGNIALDVKLKNGVVAKIVRVRGDKVPSTCEISGPIPEVSFNRPVKVVVDETGKFKGSYTQPTFGNVSTMKGRFDGETVTGKLRVNFHYPAEAEYPEENCDTGNIPFTAELGAPDEVAPDAG